jgi:lipopolysaccharide transport system ATP-binding protein
VTELPGQASNLDAVLIGGGFVIRFDKEVAPGYKPPISEIHHPTGYWLTPALIALHHGIPLIWNAPGMHCNEIPRWAEPLMDVAFSNSSYIAVRDEASRSSLLRFAANADISVTPDTAFGVARLLDERTSAECKQLRERLGLRERYILVEAASGLESFVRFFKDRGREIGQLQVLALPLSPVLGEDPALVVSLLPDALSPDEWPRPLVLAELIRNAEAVVGHSYHLAITALVHGVPVFTPADLSRGKYSALAKFDAMHQLPVDGVIDPKWVASRMGRTAPSAEIDSCCRQLSAHWNRVAGSIMQGSDVPHPDVNRFLQSLPGLLEATNGTSNGIVKRGGRGMRERLRRITRRH